MSYLDLLFLSKRYWAAALCRGLGCPQEKTPLFFSPPQVEKRIALYWHNGRSLGHTVRSATLGQALLTYIPESIVVGITGASKGFELLPPAMDLVKIPSYLTYDSSEGIHTNPVLFNRKEQFQRIRENLILTFMQDFQPHALVSGLPS